MGTPYVTWLGQASVVVAAPDESLRGKWTRGEKILLLGVFVNALFLIYEIKRSR